MHGKYNTYNTHLIKGQRRQSAFIFLNYCIIKLHSKTKKKEEEEEEVEERPA